MVQWVSNSQTTFGVILLSVMTGGRDITGCRIIAGLGSEMMECGTCFGIMMQLSDESEESLTGSGCWFCDVTFGTFSDGEGGCLWIHLDWCVARAYGFQEREAVTRQGRARGRERGEA